MFKSSLLLGIFLLAGCASTNPQLSPLKERFIEVAATANESNIVALAPTIYTQELLGDDFPPSPEELWTALLWQSLPERESYFEKITGSSGCLSVNGYTTKNSPAAIHINYVQSDNIWLINLIELEHLESASDFASEAKCPVDIMAEFDY